MRFFLAIVILAYDIVCIGEGPILVHDSLGVLQDALSTLVSGSHPSKVEIVSCVNVPLKAVNACYMIRTKRTES